MKLYYAPNSIALVSLIALEEIGAPYTPVLLNFAAAEQKGPAYLSINPKARVPSLVIGDTVLTETVAILFYLGQTLPTAKLLPDDPLDIARVQELNAYLASTVHVSHAHRLRGARWSDDPVVIEAVKLKVAQNMGDHFAYLESRFDGPWAMGAAYTISDPYLFVLSAWLARDGVDITRFPKIAAHHARMLTRPAVQRALAIQGPLN